MSDTLENRRKRGLPKKASIKGEEIAQRGSRIHLKEGEGAKGFFGERYPHTERLRIEWDDGDSMIDSIKGLNRGHALSRAAANWPSAKRIVALGGKAIRGTAKILGKVSGAIGPPDVRRATERKRVDK